MIGYKMPVEKYVLLDITGIVFGIRKFVSDIAWIQLLQYYGSSEDTQEFNEHNHLHCEHGRNYGGGKYYDLLKLTQRIIRLDPYFIYAYLYSSASLTWNLNRPEEGLSLLKEGISNKLLQRNPEYWQLHLYTSAIIYKMTDKYYRMIDILEKAVKQKNCPVMVKAILANIYKKTNNYIKSLNLWIEIYESNNPDYRNYAEKQINLLKEKIKLKL